MDERWCRLQLQLTIRLCTALSRFPDVVIANSQAGREAHRRIGYAAKRFEVIENGIDAAAFQAPELARGEVRRAWHTARRVGGHQPRQGRPDEGL